MGGRVFFYFIKKDMSDADTVQRGRDIRVGAVGNGGMPAGYDQGLFTELYKVPGMIHDTVFFFIDPYRHIEH